MVPLLLLIVTAGLASSQQWRPHWVQPQVQPGGYSPWRQQPLQVHTRISAEPFEQRDDDQSHTWYDVEAVPQTPCPDIFTYEHEGGEWVGVARVVPPLNYANNNQTIRIQVALTVEALLTTKYAGKVELREGKSTVVSRLRDGGREPIEYRVRFPVQSPLPKLNAVRVNGKILCEDNPTVSNVHTTLTLGHTLYAYVNSFLSAIPPPQQALYVPPSPTRPTQTPTRPTQAPTRPTQQVYVPPAPTRPTPQQEVYVPQTPPRRTPQPTVPTRVKIITDGPPTLPAEGERDVECGVIINPLHLILGGSDVREGAWPWLVAMFVKTNVGLDFKCGGSLVSASHVVTAAHCVKPPYKEQLAPKMIILYMGKHSLLNWTEQHSQARDVGEIVIHPGYEGSSGKTDSDLAVLVLSVPVTITPSVWPICLWRSGAAVSGNQEGTVVGWGKQDHSPGHSVSDVPLMVRMPIVTQEECLRSHRSFYYLTSENTFCAGGREGSGPCNGDSGGGMYFPEKTLGGSTRWMLRGVVSLSLQDENTSCDLLNYVVFTDVARFASWISDVMNRGRSRRRTRP